MNEIEKRLLKEIADLHKIPEGSYNIRKNGESVSRNSTSEIQIISKKDKSGIDIIVAKGVKGKSCHIPVIITKSGLSDVVYNDFYIGEGADVLIIAGCGINCTGKDKSQHDGIHTFHLAKNSKVRYVEKHLAFGNLKAEKVLNPTTKIVMEENSVFEMETTQIGGVTYADRKTFAKLKDGAKLFIKEKILTEKDDFAKTKFQVTLEGKNSSVDVVSRSVAKNNSKQEFMSNLIGKNECYGRVECDGIITDDAKLVSIPKIDARTSLASLAHEAIIGKIAGDQLVKLMSLGLSKEEAEQAIIQGFLK